MYMYNNENSMQVKLSNHNEAYIQNSGKKWFYDSMWSLYNKFDSYNFNGRSQYVTLMVISYRGECALQASPKAQISIPGL